MFSWKHKFLGRILPLWAAAAALSFAPHVCWGFRVTGHGAAPGVSVVYLTVLLPLVAAAYYLAGKRRWWGVLAGGAVVCAIGAGFVLNAMATSGRHLHYHYEEAIIFPAAAGIMYVVLAVAAVLDREWTWRKALGLLRPGWAALAFVAWAGAAALVWYSAWRNLVSVWYFPEPPYQAIAWTVLHVLVLAELFQFALRAPGLPEKRGAVPVEMTAARRAHARGGLTLRGALCFFSVCWTLGAMDKHLATRTFGFGTATVGTTGLTLAGLMVYLAQDELRMRLPLVAWRARQRVFVNRRTAVAAAVAAAFLLGVALWSVRGEGMAWWAPVLYVPAAGVTFVVMLHLALVARLRALLVVKLGFSCLTLAAATDLLFAACRIGAGLFETLTVGIGGPVQDQLRVGMISFSAVAWAAACTIAHFEHRNQPLEEDARGGERGEAPA